MKRGYRRQKRGTRPQILIVALASLCLPFSVGWHSAAAPQPTPQSIAYATSGPVGPESLPESEGQVLGLSTLANNISSALTAAEQAAQPQPSASCGQVACVALSFDDGPDPSSTAKILNALDDNFVTATFFLIGNRVQPNAAVVKRMSASGYTIGNHSWAHPDFTKLSANSMKQQIDQTQNAITGLGLPAPTLFRPPYGARNNLMRQTIHMPIILWNVDPKDWNEKDPSKIASTVIEQAKPGAIILMHDREATAAAVPTIVKQLKTKYRLVSVPELLNLQPDSQGEFFAQH